MPHIFTKQSRDSRPLWLSLGTRNAPSYIKRRRYKTIRHIQLVSILCGGHTNHLLNGVYILQKSVWGISVRFGIYRLQPIVPLTL
jgi:hypothetical protein